MNRIRAGILSEIEPESGEWVVVDVGFSSKSRSCGVLTEHSPPEEVMFSEMVNLVTQIATIPGKPLNLLIEAPLSAAFNAKGNPTGRSIERREGQHRYWYEGLACLVLVSAGYLITSVAKTNPQRDIRLFEGFASFKQKGVISSHVSDVTALRDAAWNWREKPGSLVGPDQLANAPGDTLLSAFAFAGLDFGVPPVVIAMG